MGLRPLAFAAMLFVLGCGPSAPPRNAPVPDDEIPVTTSSAEAKTLFLKGRDAVYARNEKLAIDSLEKALSLDKDFSLAHLYLARALDNIEDPRAEQHMEDAFRSAEKTKASPGERYLIQAYDYDRHAETESQNGTLSLLLGLYPKDKYAAYELGRYYDFGARRLNDAVERYEEVITLDPSFAPAYNSVAYVYADLGNFSKASERIKKFAELDKDNPNAQDSAGEILLWAGDYQGAIKSYESALAKDPSFFYSYLGQGHAYSFLGDTAKARDAYQRSVAAAKSDAEKLEPAYWIAVSYLFEKNPGEASAKLTALLPEADKFPALGRAERVRLDLAWISLYTGNLDQATAQVSDAQRWLAESKLSESDRAEFTRESLVLEGLILLAKNDLDAAKATLAKIQGASSARRNPREQEYANTLRAALALAQSDFAQTQEALSKAGDTNPYNFEIAIRLAGAKGDTAAQEKARAAARAWNRNSLRYGLVLLQLGASQPTSAPSSAPGVTPTAPATPGAPVLPAPVEGKLPLVAPGVVSLPPAP